MTDFPFTGALRQQVGANFSNFSRTQIPDEQLRPAAVAIVIVKHDLDDRASVLLTLRPEHINRHSGQFALPGGLLNEGEAAIEGSLRELKEELGVELSPDARLGTLDDYGTRSGFKITPVVFWGGDRLEINPDPGEVEQVYHIPLAELNRPDIPQFKHHEDSDRQVVYFEHLPAVGGDVYAPTAAMLYQFREVGLRGNHTRVAHYDQPKFAWN